MLAEFDPPVLPSTLVVRGDTIYVGTFRTGTKTAAPVSAIVEISAATRTKKNYPLGGDIPMLLVAGDRSLFFLRGNASTPGDGVWGFDYSDIARFDTTTGQLSVVDHELFPWGSVVSVAGNAYGEVFWTMRTSAVDSTTVIRHWDRATSSVTTVMTNEQSSRLFVDFDRLYWTGKGQSGVPGLFSAPLNGGSVSTLVAWPGDSTTVGTIVAVDDQNVYYLQTTPGNGPLSSMPKQGGGGLRLVLPARTASEGNLAVDATHLYWVDSDNSDVLRRMPKNGGDMEIFFLSASGPIEDFVVDRCIVYWIDGGGYRLMAKGK